jgi:hypothetical protein
VVWRRKPQSIFCASVRLWLYFFLDPEDIMNLNIRDIWNFGKATGLL